MNHPNVKMASIAELVGADDEAQILCDALAKAITRLERDRDRYDADAMRILHLANLGHEARIETLTHLQDEVTKLQQITERTVKERDVVVDALRNLVGEAEQVSDTDMNSSQAERWDKFLTQAKELLTVIDQQQQVKSDEGQKEAEMLPPPPAEKTVVEG